MRVLIVLILAAVAGYYVYQGTFVEPEEPSCEAQLASCVRACRRTATESSAAQACQKGCRDEQAACERAAG